MFTGTEPSSHTVSPGHDWIVVQLGARGTIQVVEVDTNHFKGNYPDRCSIQAVLEAHGTAEEIAAAAEGWPVLLDEVKLQMDNIHVFREGLAKLGPVKYVRLNIYPDGGVSRLRMMGRKA